MTKWSTLCLVPVLLPAAVAQEMPPMSQVPQLLRLLHSEDAAVRRQAAEGLGERGEVIGLPREFAVPELIAVFASDPDAKVADAAAFSLAVIGSWPHGAFDHVAASLEGWVKAGADRRLAERLQQTLAAGAKAWPGRAVVPELVELLRVPACRASVLGALATLGEDAVAAAAPVEALLADRDAALRWRAAFTLFRIGKVDTPGLRRAVTDEHAAVRLWASRARLADPARADGAALVLPWLTDERRMVRGWAFQVVVELGPAAGPAVEKVARQLQDPAWGSQALQVIARLGKDASAAVPHLVPLLASEHSLYRVADVLGLIGPAADAAVDPLLQLAKAPPPKDQAVSHDENARFTVVRALGLIAPERAIAELLPGVEQRPEDDHPSTWYRVWRFQGLGAAAAPALPRLRALLASDHRTDKARALLAMRIGAGALPALPEVLPFLGSDDGYLSFIAMQVVESIGPAAAATALPVLERIRARTPDRWRKLAGDLHRLGVAAEPMLVAATTDGERWTRALAVQHLLQLPELSDGARAAVLTCLTDADEQVRQYAFSGLERSPAMAGVALEQARLLLLKTSDAQLRQACLSLLLRKQGRNGENGWQESAFEQLLQAWRARERPAADLGLFLDPARTATWVRSFAADQVASNRVAAARALGALPAAAESLATLTGLLDDGETEVRRAALMALGSHGQEARAALAVIAKARDDTDWAVRAAATAALRAVHGQ